MVGKKAGPPPHQRATASENSEPWIACLAEGYIYGASVYTQTGWRSQGDDQTSSALPPSIGGGFHPAKLRRRPLMRARQEGKRESSDARGKERNFKENKSQNLH